MVTSGIITTCTYVSTEACTCLLPVVCPIDVTTSPRGEYVWPSTVPDNLVEFNCTFGDEGVAQRYCNENGTWEVEDTAACHGKTEELFVYLDEVSYFHLLSIASTPSPLILSGTHPLFTLSHICTLCHPQLPPCPWPHCSSPSFSFSCPSVVRTSMSSCKL